MSRAACLAEASCEGGQATLGMTASDPPPMRGLAAHVPFASIRVHLRLFLSVFRHEGVPAPSRSPINPLRPPHAHNRRTRISTWEKTAPPQNYQITGLTRSYSIIWCLLLHFQINNEWMSSSKALGIRHK